MFIRPLEMFLSKFEFNNSAWYIASKIEKWSTLDIAVFYCKTIYFASFCLFFSPKVFKRRVGDELV